MKSLDILVVEDNKRHQESARQLLAGHNVEVVETFDAAMDKMNAEGKRYDALLSDLFYTQGRGECLRSRYQASEEMPFGFPLALIAARKGIKYIAVVTDLDHHAHPLAYSFDFLKESPWKIALMRINQAYCMFFDNRDLPAAYVLNTGEVTEVNPRFVEDNSAYAKQGNDHLTAKNWKAALEEVVSAEGRPVE